MKHINTCILDDEEPFLKVVAEIISKHFDVKATTDPNQFIEWAKEMPSVAVVDMNLGAGLTGMNVIKKVIELNPLCHPIFMSSLANIPMLIEIINTGYGCFFVPKDKTDWLDEVIHKIGVAKALLKQKMEASNREIERRKLLDEKVIATLKLLER